MAENGDDVKRLQQRLTDMAFDPGPVDGQFGPATQAAVWAYQKARRGRHPATGHRRGQPQPRGTGSRARSAHPAAPVPNAARPTTLEVYLPQQVAVFFQGDVALSSQMSVERTGISGATT